MKTGVAKMVLFGFAVFSVAVILLYWKAQDREQALVELESVYGIDFTVFDGEVRMTAANSKVKDLNQIADLMERVERLRDGTPLNPEVLDVSKNSAIKTLHGVTRFKSLRSIIASECVELTDITGISGLPQLSEIILSYNPKLSEVSGIKNLPWLQTVDLSNARSLTRLDSINLPALENLYLTGCRSLQSLDVTPYPQLKQLYLDGCMLIEKIEGLDQLIELTDLDISNCQKLQHWEGLEKLSSLVVFDTRNIELPDFSVIAKLPVLEVLRLAGQENLSSLTPFTGMTRLRELYIESCPNLTSLEGIPPTIVDLLWVIRCPKLESVAGLGAAKMLQVVEFKECEALTDISELKMLPELSRLSLMHCRKIRNVQVLAQHKKLTVVQLGDTGVVAADIEELQKTLKETVFDFAIPE
jgi:Leucine-rich repeat (LRR) protein